MKNKILALVISVMMIVTVFPMASFGADGSFEPSVYGKEVRFLQDIGVVDDIFDTSVNMTRSEFAVLVLKALGYDSLVTAGTYDVVFDDVPANHSAFSYIMYAYKCGLFNGTSSTTFNPDGEVSMNQAITVAVKMLGYEHHAAAMGGWPAGYVSMANKLNLLDGINIIPQREAAHRSWIYILIYNTLHCDMLIHTGIGENIQYEIFEGRNILTENHDIAIMEGILTGIDDIAIDGNEPGDGYFSVDGVVVKTGNVIADGMIGNKVTCYAKKVGSDYEAIALYEEDNRSITVTDEQIQDFNYQQGIYVIADGDKNMNLKIGNDYHLIYNGVKITGSQEELMKPLAGSVKLTDNDDDNVYEIVEVEEYYNIVVSRYDSYKNTIYDKNPQESIPGNATERNVDLDSYDVIEGNAEPEKLQEGDIVSVFKSPDGKKVRLEISGISVSGVIDEITSGPDVKYIIGSSDYALSPDCRFDPSTLRSGMEINALCDVCGKITYVTSKSNYLSGYILEFSDPLASGMGKDSVNILTGSGTPQAYTLADKVRIRTQSGARSYSSDVLAPEFGTNGREFVLYVTNSDREIVEFILPLVINTKAEFDNPPEYPLYKLDYFMAQWPGNTTSKQFREEICGFDNWLVFDSKANVFTVPGEADDYSDESVDVSKITSFTNKSYKQLPSDINADRVIGEFDVYRIGNETTLPNVMIDYARVSAKPIQEDSSPSVVTAIRTIADTVKGGEAISLSMLEVSSKREYKVKDGVSLSFSGGIKLGVGDVIKYSVDSEGYIANIELYYSNSQNKLISNPADNYNSIDRLCRLAYGEVVKNSNGCLEMEMTYDGNSKIERYAISNMRTIIISEDRTGINAEVGTSSSIASGDKIIIYSRYLRNNLIIAYKEA